MARAAGFVHFTVGFDADTSRRVVAPQHCVIAFPLRGQKSKHHSALFTLRAVREEEIPRDPNVQGPVANHLRYKPPDERKAIPGADEYVEFELLSRAHEKPSQQPLRIAMGAARMNEESGHKEFVRIDLGQCIAFIATDVIDDPKSGQRLVQNRWWMCIETLRLLCTVNRIDCSALDKPSSTPLEWVICLVDTRAPINKKEQPQEPPEKNINELMEFIDGGHGGGGRHAGRAMMTPALAPTPPAATPAATIAAAGDAIGKGERQARSRKKKGGKDKDMPEAAAQPGGCAGGREETYRQPKFDGTSILNSGGDSAVDVFAAVDGCDGSHDPMMEECEIRPSTSTIGGSGPAAAYLPAVGARKAEALEDPLDFELMDELLRKYNRLQESSQRLEQDTKVAVVRELLEVLDELERAGASLTESESTKASQMVRAVAAKFEAKLRGLGLRRVEALGRPFDPRLHRAVERSALGGGSLLNVDFVAESPELPTQLEEVTEELESGWVLGDVVVRPALVATGRHGPEEA